MVWSEQSDDGPTAVCRTTTIHSGASVRLTIAVRGADDVPPHTEVNALLVPLACAPAVQGGEPTLPPGTLRAGAVQASGMLGAAIEYTAEFSLPAGVVGPYQLVIDWRYTADDGEYIVVGNDDPRSIFHVVAPAPA